MPAIVLWVACAIATFFIAKSRGANAPAWAVAGFILGPFGIVYALLRARASDPSIAPLAGRALASFGCLWFIALAAWMIVGFAVVILVGALFQSGRGENDPARLYIGLAALGAGALVAIVGMVVTLRAIRRRMAGGRPASPAAGDRGR